MKQKGGKKISQDREGGRSHVKKVSPEGGFDHMLPTGRVRWMLKTPSQDFGTWS